MSKQSILAQSAKENQFKCEICEKEFKSQSGLNGHKRVHGESKGALKVSKETKIKNAFKYAKRIRKEWVDWNKEKRKCKECDSLLAFDRRTSNFCNQSCSVSFSNSNRDSEIYKSVSEKNKISNMKAESIISMINYEKNVSLQKRCQWCHSVIDFKRSYYSSTCSDECKSELIEANLNIKNNNVIIGLTGEYSPVFWNKCIKCEKISSLNRKSEYCYDCMPYKNARSMYSFNWNLQNYSNLFDIDEINSIGFYSPFVNDTSMLTRDHRLSIYEAYNNDYDIYYITHPINCQYISFKKNVSKNRKSSLSYSELVRIVDLYDSGEYELAKSEISKYDI